MLGKLTLEIGVSKSSVHAATKLLHLKPYKFTPVLQLHKAEHAVRVQMCNRFCEAVCNGVINQLPTYLTDDTWFYFNGHVNT